MRAHTCLSLQRQAVARIPCRPARLRRLCARAQSDQQWDSSQEKASQIRRLIDRDRKEFLGQEDILAKYRPEFDDLDEKPSTDSSAAASTTTATVPPPTASPFAASTSAAAKSPFKAGPPQPSSPFGGPVTQSRSKLEPLGLSPYLSPDPILAEDKWTFVGLVRSITSTQVLLAISFSLIIALMGATFYLVVQLGAVKLAGIE